MCYIDKNAKRMLLENADYHFFIVNLRFYCCKNGIWFNDNRIILPMVQIKRRKRIQQEAREKRPIPLGLGFLAISSSKSSGTSA
jgi:hypothetical protein